MPRLTLACLLTVSSVSSVLFGCASTPGSSQVVSQTYCGKESRTGTNLVSSVCRTAEQRDKDKADSEEFSRALLPNTPQNIGR